MFGKNIKKIRSVKGLSQQAFADLFGLKRGTLAAYEEGRSNPRVETVIKIAAHFQLETDDLLKNELTVNKLLQFNDNLTTQADTLPVQQFASIPCIVQAVESEFVRQRGSAAACKRLPVLQLPLQDGRQYIGYQVHSAEMGLPGGGGFLPRDIAIGKKVDLPALVQLPPSTTVLVLTEDALHFKKMTPTGESLVLKAALEGIDPVEVPHSGIVQAWHIQHAFWWKLPGSQSPLEVRLAQLEQKLQALSQ